MIDIISTAEHSEERTQPFTSTCMCVLVCVRVCLLDYLFVCLLYYLYREKKADTKRTKFVDLLLLCPSKMFGYNERRRNSTNLDPNTYPDPNPTLNPNPNPLPRVPKLTLIRFYELQN